MPTFNPNLPYGLVQGAAGPAVFVQGGYYYERDGSLVDAPADDLTLPVTAKVDPVSGDVYAESGNYPVKFPSVSNKWKLLTEALKYLHLVPGWLSSANSVQAKGFPTISWVTGKLVATGAIRTNAGNLYYAVAPGGTTGATAPTHTTGQATDGAVVWRWLDADPYIWSAGMTAVKGQYISNAGEMYVCTAISTGIAGAVAPTANSTAITDGGITWARIQQVWVDTIYGDEANDGLSPLTPKKTIANYLASTGNKHRPFAYRHHWIAAGSEFTLDMISQSTTGCCISLELLCTSLTVYDRATGNEILDQPNPFQLGLNLQWVSDYDKANKYFKVSGNATDTSSDLYSGTFGSGINTLGGGVCNKVRGAYITGFPRAGLNVEGSTAAHVIEDCIIEDCRTIGSVTDRVEGAGIRWASATNGTILRRIAISGCGTDGIWSSLAAGPYNFVFEDLVIHHAILPTAYQGANAEHTDGIQMGKYPGAAFMNRVIIEHDMSQVSFPDNPPIGAALIVDATGTAGTNTMTMQDCIICSNYAILNCVAAGAPPNNSSNLFYVQLPENPQGRITGINFNDAVTLTDAVIVSDGFRPFDSLLRGIVPTLTTCRRIDVK